MKTKLNLAIFYLLLSFVNLTHAVELLPNNLESFTSVKGEKYLKESINSNLLELLSHFTTQQTTTYCGVASVVMVLNSSSLTKPADPEHAPYHYFTQEEFFTDQVKNIITKKEVIDHGITLNQLNSIAQTFGLKTSMYYANQLNLEKFGKILKKAISNGQFVIVNFLRSGLNQVGGGHHSPVAAYDEKQDRFLMLDVARYKYPAYWVKTKDLWQATHTKDGDTWRGFIIIEP